MWYVIVVLKILSVITGAFLLFVRYFLYEKEQGIIESKIQDLWNRINNLQPVALSRHVAFMHVLAETMEKLFDRLFGPRLVSLQALIVSICYSFASALLTTIVASLYFLHHVFPFAIRWFFFYFALGSLPLIFRTFFKKHADKLILIWCTVLITSVYWEVIAPTAALVGLVYESQYSRLTTFIISICLCFLLAIALFYGSIVILRITVRKVRSAKSLFQIATILVLNLVPLLPIYGVIKLLDLRFRHWTSIPDFTGTEAEQIETFTRMWSSWGMRLDIVLVLLVVALIYFEFIFLITAATSLLMALFILLHRAFWPTLLRLLNASSQHQILRKGRVLLILGTIFILIGVGKYSWLVNLFTRIFD